MATEALYADGESIMSQARSANTIELAFANGMSGDIPFGQPSGIATFIKTINGLAKSSVKTINGLLIALVKTINGLS